MDSFVFSFLQNTGTQLQIDYQINCEEKESVTEKELNECDERKNKWLSDCVFGDHKLE